MLVFVLAAPMALASSTTTFKGAVAGDENSKVTFKVVKNQKGKRRVDVPKGLRLDATCDGATYDIDVYFGSGLKSAKVADDGTFEFDNSGETWIAVVRGDITGKSATGTLHYQGATEFPDGDKTCDTGEVKWDALKTKQVSPRAREVRCAESSPSASLATRP